MLQLKINFLSLVYSEIKFPAEPVMKINNLSRPNFPAPPPSRIKWSSPNVPVRAPTRGQPFYGYSEKPPQFSRLLRHTRGYGRHILALTIGSPWGHRIKSWIYTCTCINWKWHYVTLMKLFLNSILISSSEDRSEIWNTYWIWSWDHVY